MIPEERKKQADEAYRLLDKIINTAARLDINKEFFGLTEEEFTKWDEDYRKEYGIGLKEGMERVKQRLSNPKANFKDRIDNLEKLRKIYEQDERKLLQDLLYTYKQEKGLNYLSFNRSVMGIYDDNYSGLTGISISYIHWDDNNIWCAGSTESGFDIEELKIEGIEINLIAICKRIFKALYENEVN